MNKYVRFNKMHSSGRLVTDECTNTNFCSCSTGNVDAPYNERNLFVLVTFALKAKKKYKIYN